MKKSDEHVEQMMKTVLKKEVFPEPELIQKVKYRLTDAQKDLTGLKVRRRSWKAVTAAAAIVAVLSVFAVGFAYGERIITMLGGGVVEEGANEEGDDTISVDSGFYLDPVSVRAGRIYFTLAGPEVDITEQVSPEQCYRYEVIDDEGYRHVVLIGGTAERIETAEYIWNPKGEFTAGSASYQSDEEPLWLISEKVLLEID